MVRSVSLATAILVATTAVAPAVSVQNSPPSRAAADAAGWNAAALAEAASYAQSQKSTGLLIIQNRRIVAEANWPLGPDAAVFRNNFVHGTTTAGALLEDVASQQKSFVAVLVGVAIDKGLLDISKPVAAYARRGVVEGLGRAGGGDHRSPPAADEFRPQGGSDLRNGTGREILLQHTGLRGSQEGARGRVEAVARRSHPPLVDRAPGHVGHRLAQTP